MTTYNELHMYMHRGYMYMHRGYMYMYRGTCMCIVCTCTQGRSHRSGWSGFNRTTFRGSLVPRLSCALVLRLNSKYAHEKRAHP